MGGDGEARFHVSPGEGIPKMGVASTYGWMTNMSYGDDRINMGMVPW